MFNKIVVIFLAGLMGCTQTARQDVQATVNPVEITEWVVPWEDTRPRDPYVDRKNRVWFVGQRGDYVAALDPSTGKFTRYDLEPGAGPHNVIVDKKGNVWYAGNRAAHIGRLNPQTGDMKKYPMPDSEATDPHTLVFGKDGEIWFTVQHSNFIGHLSIETGKIDLIPVPTSHGRPYGIVVNSSFTLWIAEFGTNKLGTMNPDTKTVKEILLPRSESRPRRLAITSDQAVWYVDYAEGYLGRYIPKTGAIREWRTPGGSNSGPYAMTSDDQDRVWFVETGLQPNRLVGFDTRSQRVMSVTPIKSGGGTVRHMVYHPTTKTLWFGTDTNTIGRAKVP